MAKQKQKDVVGAVGEPPAEIKSRYAQETGNEEQDDDGVNHDLPLVDLDKLDAEGLTAYGIRNLNMDLTGKTVAQMRDALANQIGRHRAGLRA